LPQTSLIIQGELKKLGIPFVIINKTGILATLKFAKPGKVLLLRADMDALPILEESGVPYASKVPGNMHACGHDSHMANMLGTTMILNSLKDVLQGTIKLMFQPCEEIDAGGAKLMIENGILENPNVDAAIAMHCGGCIKTGDNLPQEGDFEIRSGSCSGSPDDFFIRIIGKGGHAAAPHLAIDPIVIAAQFVNAAQTIVSRYVNPLRAGLITFGTINAGQTTNVIPEYCDLSGTARSSDPDTRKILKDKLEEVLKSCCEAFHATYTFKYELNYPPMVTDEKITNLVKNAAAKILGKEHVFEIPESSLGAEDFSYVAEKVPSAFYRITLAPDVFGHHPKFKINGDKYFYNDMCVMAQSVFDFLVGGE
jgi:amidohydrolase